MALSDGYLTTRTIGVGRMTVKGDYSGLKGELAAFDVVVSPHIRENLNRSGAYINIEAYKIGGLASM